MKRSITIVSLFLVVVGSFLGGCKRTETQVIELTTHNIYDFLDWDFSHADATSKIDFIGRKYYYSDTSITFYPTTGGYFSDVKLGITYHITDICPWYISWETKDNRVDTTSTYISLPADGKYTKKLTDLIGIYDGDFKEYITIDSVSGTFTPTNPIETVSKEVAETIMLE